MKFFVAISFALLAYATADVSHLAHSGYDYPAPVHEEVKSEPIAPQNTYVPPAPVAPAPALAPAPVAPQATYIPPAEPAAPAQVDVRSEPVAPPPPPPAPPAPVAPAPASVAPENTYVPPPAARAPEPSATLEDDGYHYKTVRRVVYRYRA